MLGQFFKESTFTATQINNTFCPALVDQFSNEWVPEKNQNTTNVFQDRAKMIFSLNAIKLKFQNLHFLKNKEMRLLFSPNFFQKLVFDKESNNQAFIEF